MIRFANENDTPKIKALWDIVFDDDAKFNDYYFQNIFNVNNTLIMEDNDNLISMAQMIPYQLEGVGDVSYIYGAATDSLYRGKGYMKELLYTSFEYDIKLGRNASILIPAEKSLFDYYQNVGYETAFYIDNITYQNTNKYDYIFKKADYNDIDNMLKIYDGDITRDTQYFKIQIDMFNALDGDVFVLYDDKQMLNYAFVWNKNEIQEICGVCFDIMSNHIMKHYSKPYTKATIMGGSTLFGMIKYHSNTKPHNMKMNLMFN